MLFHAVAAVQWTRVGPKVGRVLMAPVALSFLWLPQALHPVPIAAFLLTVSFMTAVTLFSSNLLSRKWKRKLRDFFFDDEHQRWQRRVAKTFIARFTTKLFVLTTLSASTLVFESVYGVFLAMMGGMPSSASPTHGTLCPAHPTHETLFLQLISCCGVQVEPAVAAPHRTPSASQHKRLTPLNCPPASSPASPVCNSAF